MKFSYSTLLVKNMDETLSFYRDVLGLSIAGRFSPVPGLELAMLDTGETQIELVCSEESAGAVTGSAVSFGFEVESLDDMLALMKVKGIPIHSGPFYHPNVKFFFILDPNGLKIELKETI